MHMNFIVCKQKYGHQLKYYAFLHSIFYTIDFGNYDDVRTQISDIKVLKITVLKIILYLIKLWTMNK